MDEKLKFSEQEHADESTYLFITNIEQLLKFCHYSIKELDFVISSTQFFVII